MAGARRLDGPESSRRRSAAHSQPGEERIVAFSTETGRSAESIAGASNGATANGAGQPRRTYLIIVDTLHSFFANFSHTPKALARFFEKEKGDDAQYAVMALGRDLKVVQDSTSEAV